MGNLAALSLNLALLIGDITLMMGYTQGREYAEFIFLVDVLIVIAFALLGINMIATIVRRTPGRGRRSRPPPLLLPLAAAHEYRIVVVLWDTLHKMTGIWFDLF
jgi:hypothetical protein